MKKEGNRLTPEEGMLITNANHTVIANTIYLGKYDSESNYFEITIEEADELIKELK